MEKRKTYNMKHDVWYLGWLLFMICNKNDWPFDIGKRPDDVKEEASKW